MTPEPANPSPFSNTNTPVTSGGATNVYSLSLPFVQTASSLSGNPALEGNLVSSPESRPRSRSRSYSVDMVINHQSILSRNKSEPITVC